MEILVELQDSPELISRVQLQGRPWSSSLEFIPKLVPKLCSQDNIGDGYVLSGNRCYATCGNGRPGGAVLCKEDTTWDESGLWCPDLWCACPPHIMSRINQMMASVSFASGEFCISCTKREWVVKEVYLYDSWCILNLNILETRN